MSDFSEAMMGLTSGQMRDMRRVVREEIERAFTICRCEGRICNCGKRKTPAADGGIRYRCTERIDGVPIPTVAERHHRAKAQEWAAIEKYHEMVAAWIAECDAYDRSG